MVRVHFRKGGHIDIGGGTMRCDVGPSGALAIMVVQEVSKMTPQGMMNGMETTPVKIYAADQWREVEWVEEPGDGLTVLPRSVDSRA